MRTSVLINLFIPAVLILTTALPCYAANPASLGYFQEKLHVSTDKDDYIAGDTIRLRAHCVDAATHRPLCASRYVYVELRDADGALTQRVKLMARDSTYSGFVPTPQIDSAGEYSLIAYTFFMRNQGEEYFFKKTIAVAPYQKPETTDTSAPQRQVADFDVAFFPEGGYLTDGAPCRVAFKALGDDGLSVGIRGTLLDSRGKVIDSLRTIHAGMGSLRFTPQPGERYHAECTIPSGKNKRFELPASEPAACVLGITQTDRDLTVGVRSGHALPEGLALAVLCRGQLHYCKAWDAAQGPLTFERTVLPGGVLQFLLLDKSGRALSERLLFNPGEESASATVACAGIPDPRRKITLNVSAVNPDGTPASGDFSIAVTDRNAVPAPASASIGTTLLLTSELRGNIEAPDWYFNTSDTTARAGLDALMLTQGWRRYDVSAALRGEAAELSYPLEAGQEITGTIRKNGLWNRSKRLNQYEMQVLAPRYRFTRQVPIDANGCFAINGFDFPDSTLFVLRPVAVEGLLPEATVRVVPDSFPTVAALPRCAMMAEREAYTAQAYSYIGQRGQSDMRNILIDSVVIARHKPIEPETPESRFARHSWTAEKIKEMGAYSILEFVMRMPGIVAKGNDIYYHGTRPDFMLDGVIEEAPKTAIQGGRSVPASRTRARGFDIMNTNIPSYTGDPSLTLPACVNWPMIWVSRIELITGAYTLLWGPTKGNAIISIVTKTGAELDAATAATEAADVTISSPLGYQIPAAFYSPAYPTEQSRASKVPDYRTTLYWNPAVTLDDNGRAQVQFYTSDAPADYNITIEGVSKQGKIIRSAQTL